jgi:hypothetical protein
MHKATIVRDASGVPTGLSGIATEGLLSAAMSTVTGIVDQDTILIPENILDSVVIAGVPAVLGAVVQKRIDTGAFGIPFKV